MVLKWKKELVAAGYSFRKNRFSKEINSFITADICEGKNVYSNGEISINLGVEIKDVFSSEVKNFYCLVGLLNDDSIVIQETLQPHRKWREEDEPNAKEALFKYGLSWLHKYCNQEVLIDYFETCLDNGIPMPMLKKNGIIAKIVNEMAGIKKDDSPKRAPGHHHVLSLLYHEKGDLQMACLHANRYLFHMKGSFAETSIIKQIMAMGGDVKDLQICDQCGR